jgi:hypothetical protein
MLRDDPQNPPTDHSAMFIAITDDKGATTKVREGTPGDQPCVHDRRTADNVPIGAGSGRRSDQGSPSGGGTHQAFAVTSQKRGDQTTREMCP